MPNFRVNNIIFLKINIIHQHKYKNYNFFLSQLNVNILDECFIFKD
jgi:hypothetical protein